MQELVSNGIITRDHLERAKLIQRQRGGTLGEILVEMGAVDVNKFVDFVKKYTGR
ncbi:MAG: hypothetical protein AABZ39_12075 [Spirochaetota bacterium]